MSSIPAVGFVRWGRAARAARILRVLRGVRSYRTLGGFILARRAQSALLAAILVTILSTVFCAIAVLQLERDGGGNIATGIDALWWAVVTVATVGYGDRVPITPEGRLFALGLMVVGVALFSTVTAFIASWFMAPEEDEQDRELAAIRQELSVIRGMLEEAGRSGAVRE